MHVQWKQNLVPDWSSTVHGFKETVQITFGNAPDGPLLSNLSLPQGLYEQHILGIRKEFHRYCFCNAVPSGADAGKSLGGPMLTSI
jgi:hypothetical protein